MATAMQHSQTVARTLASVGSTDRDVDVRWAFLCKRPLYLHMHRRCLNHCYMDCILFSRAMA